MVVQQNYYIMNMRFKSPMDLFKLTNFFRYLIDESIDAITGSFQSFRMGANHLYQLWYVGRYLQI